MNCFSSLSKSRRFKDQKGLTLLELMVVAGILVVAITGLLSAIVSSYLLNAANNNKSIAATDAQFVLEQLQNTAYANLASYNENSFTNLPDEEIAVTVTLGSGVKNVLVTVTWTENDRERSFEIETQRALAINE